MKRVRRYEKTKIISLGPIICPLCNNRGNLYAGIAIYLPTKKWTYTLYCQHFTRKLVSKDKRAYVWQSGYPSRCSLNKFDTETLLTSRPWPLNALDALNMLESLSFENCSISKKGVATRTKGFGTVVCPICNLNGLLMGRARFNFKTGRQYPFDYEVRHQRSKITRKKISENQIKVVFGNHSTKRHYLGQLTKATLQKLLLRRPYPLDNKKLIEKIDHLACLEIENYFTTMVSDFLEWRKTIRQ